MIRLVVMVVWVIFILIFIGHVWREWKFYFLIVKEGWAKEPLVKYLTLSSLLLLPFLLMPQPAQIWIHKNSQENLRIFSYKFQ